MLSIIVLLLATLLGRTTSYDLFPMNVGAKWLYKLEGALDLEIEVIRPTHRSPAGAVTFRSRCLNCGGQSEYVDVHYGITIDGAIVQLGADWYDGQGKFSHRIWYEPPRVYLDMPLEPGKRWEWRGIVYQTTASGTVSEWSESNACEVLGYSEAEVPAGVFQVIQVSCNEFLIDSYAERVGLIKREAHPSVPYGTYSQLDLLSYVVSVPTESLTWGRIKSMYR